MRPLLILKTLFMLGSAGLSDGGVNAGAGITNQRRSVMKRFAKIALGALILAGATAAVATPDPLDDAPAQ